MAKPIINQTANLTQVSQGKNTIMAIQVKMPKIGIKGTKGTLNGRLASGFVFLKIKMPTQTIKKANKVPMLVISPTTFMGTNAAKSPINTQSIMFDLYGVLNFACTSENIFGNKPSLPATGIIDANSA